MKKIRNSYLRIKQSGDNDPNSGVFDPDVSADIDGNVRVDGLVLVDRKTGKDRQISIYDGEIMIEPLEKEERRDYRIKKIITDGSK